MPARKKLNSKSSSQNKTPHLSKLLLVTLLVFSLGLGIWTFIRSQMVASDINLISTERVPTATNTRPGVVDANGCYYQAVQCLQAPCEPVLVCPTVNNTAIPQPSLLASPSSSLTPAPSPVSSPNAIPTSLGLSSFKAINSCGTSSFKTISYACNNSSLEVLLSNGECLDFTRAYNTAYQACSVTPTAIKQ